jgi:ParB family chromosome partitioning protein
VVQKRSDHYEIIAGERRWRAAKLAKIKEVPVVIKDYTEQEIMEIALIENIQREDLNPIEEAEAYRRLIDEYNLLQEDLAKKVSKSRTAIANSMRLLKLGDEVKEMLVNNEISSGHARTLISIEDKGIQLEVAKQIVEKKLSVRETEKLVKNVLNPKPEKIVSEVDTQVEAIYKNLEDRLKTIVGTKVNISRSKKGKGKIEIEYYSQDDLERILDLFGTIN